MFDFWLADENLFFAGAGCLLLALIVLQLVGFGDFGPDIDPDLDVDIDMADASLSDGLLSFLGLGRLPMMMWLALYLMIFTIIGYSGQQIIEALTGGLLPSLIAAPSAGVVALPLTGLFARPLEHIIPKDETSAVSIDSHLCWHRPFDTPFLWVCDYALISSRYKGNSLCTNWTWR